MEKKKWGSQKKKENSEKNKRRKSDAEKTL